MLNKLNLDKERTKDLIAGIIALIFIGTAGYLALNRFNDGALELGKGGEEMISQEGSEGFDSRNGDVAGYVDYDWVATDYVEGEISEGDYTVQEGDTLWEIAEAVYGDGFMWTKILDANSSDIGFLPNGSQALIVTGQLLVIPA